MVIKMCLQRISCVIVAMGLFAGIAKADGTVKGRILDQNKRPVEFATAALISAKTKLPIKGSQSNSNGEFIIDKVSDGNYILSVTLVGYKKAETEQFAVSNKKEISKNVVLEENTQMLKEATIVAKRKFIEQQADKLVVNPDASITSASENVFDILKKTPGVNVDNNNNISLKGKEGVKVLIDDKPTYVSSDQLATLLKGMQGKDIERIEVIENPSSRYDAEGNSGIINIKTKHNKRSGFNGSFFTGGSYSNILSENAGLDLNMNFGKLNIYGNYSFYDWRGWNTMNATRKYETGPYIGSYQRISNDGDYHGSSHNFKIGADYYLTKKHVISVMARGSNGFNHNTENSISAFENSQQKLDSALNTASRNYNHWNNITYNANYKWDIDSTGRSLTVDADYARFSFKRTNFQDGNFTDANGNDMHINTTINGVQPATINIFTAKTDYTHPINKKFSIEAGLKTSFVRNNSLTDFFIIDPTNTILNNGLKPHDQFIYTENINAAYMSARGQFGKTSVQLGLRVENTNSKGDSKSMNRIDSKHYTDLFPSIFVKQELNENNQLGLTYSYRIGRPSYQILNPFVWLLDQYTYNQGNPFLRPQFTHSLGLNYTYKSMLITSIGMNRTKDLFTDILQQNDETKIMYQTKENLGRSIDLNASQTAQFDPTKWWHFNLTATVMYKSVTSDVTGTDNFKRWSYTANTTQSFTLPLGVSFELSGKYQSKQLWGNFVIYDRYLVNCGIQKSLFDKKATLKISVDDIFNTDKGGGYAKYGNVNMDVDNHWDSRSVNLSFSYRFGKDSFKTRANRSTASSEEQSRSGK